jgi:hypothetical protein
MGKFIGWNLLLVFLLESQPRISQTNQCGMVEAIQDVIPSQAVPNAHDQEQCEVANI